MLLPILQHEKHLNKIYFALFSLIAVVLCIGLQLPLLDIDSSQYAAISKEMFYNKSYLEVYCRGADYLDKPPLVFWTACLSFHVFGLHDWAFRLPSLLVLVLGIYSTYRFTKLYYPLATAKLAALIMASCQATFLMTHDVRMDTMLSGWVIFAIWQFAEYNITLKIKYIIGASIGIALAMLTKGPIGLVIPVIAFSVEFIYKKQFFKFFRWQYLIAFLIIAILLFPMSYGLYTQFDLHPEKEVYGLSGPSGLRFFYWTQSFGRITGESYWNNNPDTFFLMHSFLWSFLPWSLFFIPAVYSALKEKITLWRKQNSDEIISLGGFIIILLFLMQSNYQLPHYTFAIHPLAAIITANFLYPFIFENKKGGRTTLFVLSYIVQIVLFSVCLLILIFVFPTDMFWISGLIFLFLLSFFLTIYKRAIYFNRFILPLILVIIITNVVANVHFYPKALSFQSDSEIAQYANSSFKDYSVLTYDAQLTYSFDFYLQSSSVAINSEVELNRYLKRGSTLIITDDEGVDSLKIWLPDASLVKIFYDFPVSSLNAKFLNPATRQQALKPVYVFRY